MARIAAKMLVAAALLMFATGLAHSYLGERYLLMRLFRRDDLPRLFGGTRFTTGTLRFVWHLLTVVWWGIAVLTLRASGQALDSRNVLGVFSTVALASAVLPFVLTRGKHLSWIVFLVIGVLLRLAANAT